MIAAIAGIRRCDELRGGRTLSNRIGVLPLVGPITYHLSFLAEYFGGTHLVGFQQEIRQFWADAEIEVIITPVSSNGGEVTALIETAYLMREVRQVKPIIVVI
jgi:ClpP class serine protease